MKSSLLAVTALFCSLLACKNEQPPAPEASTPVQVEIPEEYTALAKVQGDLLIDGSASDAAWEAAEWKPMDQVWLGKDLKPEDFSGRYKVLWDANFLYVVAEITDDTLVDTHADGLLKYWDDDCLEVFIDADGSGGNHQYNYNAFAYHISLDNRSVDVASDSSFRYFDEHVTSKRTCTGKVCTWEAALRVYNDDYQDKTSVPIALKAGKKMGFMVAYCDNDKSPEREHFIGSVPIAGEDKNRGWIDAGVFEKVMLNNE